jgi:hypothetical protein
MICRCLPSPIPVGLVEEERDIAIHPLLERGEAGVVACPAQIFDLGLREILILAADRRRQGHFLRGACSARASQRSVGTILRRLLRLCLRMEPIRISPWWQPADHCSHAACSRISLAVEGHEYAMDFASKRTQAGAALPA